MGKPGRPTKLTPEVCKQIYASLSVGGTLADVADAMGIDASTLYRARKNDAVFAMGVKKAIKTGKMRLLKKIGKAKQWQAAAWMLERRWGKQFGRKDHSKVELSGKLQHAPSQEVLKILNDPTATELGNTLQRRLAGHAGGNGESAN